MKSNVEDLRKSCPRILDSAVGAVQPFQIYSLLVFSVGVLWEIPAVSVLIFIFLWTFSFHLHI